MPKSAIHSLIWSSTGNYYSLYSRGQFVCAYQAEPQGQAQWQKWLASQTSFAFQGKAGHLNLLKEPRSRGNSYWYAYYYTGKSTIKAYLGATTELTFARLEEQVRELSSKSELLTVDSSLPYLLAEKDTNSTVQPYQGQTLLLTKLTPPRVPETLVARERLKVELDASSSKPLTLVSATAGWGKTTLLADWVASQTFPVAWLALDELDNDPMYFWISVINALQRVVPGLGETALSILRATKPSGLTAVPGPAAAWRMGGLS